MDSSRVSPASSVGLRLAPRAYRRLLQPEEVERYMPVLGVAGSRHQRGGPHAMFSGSELPNGKRPTYRTGACLPFPEDNNRKPLNNRLLVSILHAIGREDVETFGNMDIEGTGPLPGLT